MQLQTVLYFLVWAAVIFLMMRVGCGAHVMGHGHHQHRSSSGNQWDGSSRRWLPPVESVDPVCGMTVQTKDTKSAVHEGHIYYFCSQDCRAKFEAAPAAHLKGAGNASHEMEHGHDVN
jgi:YHS domain-containing protein